MFSNQNNVSFYETIVIKSKIPKVNIIIICSVFTMSVAEVL